MMDKKARLMRQRVARLVAGAVHRWQSETGDTLEDVAGAVGLSGGHLHNIMSAERDQGCPADVLVRLGRLFEDSSLIEGLCELCGGTFVPRSVDVESRGEAIRAAGEAGVEASEVLAEFLGAVSDGVVSEVELARLEASVPRAAAGLSALVGLARGMVS